MCCHNTVALLYIGTHVLSQVKMQYMGTVCCHNTVTLLYMGSNLLSQHSCC
jgi:hypothetical protein